MVWGPRSMGPALILGVCEKVPPARNVPYNPSILIPLGTPDHPPMAAQYYDLGPRGKKAKYQDLTRDFLGRPWDQPWLGPINSKWD